MALVSLLGWIHAHRKESFFILINLLSWFFIFFFPIQHAKMFVVLVFALSGWALGVLPQPIVSLSIIVLIPLLKLGTFEEALSGYSQSFIWLLVSTFILAAAVEGTGLGKRIALYLLMKAKGKTNHTILYMLFSIIILGFLIPTAAGRSAMIMPVCVGVFKVISSKELLPSFSKSVMLGVAFTSSFMSWAIITGSSSSIYAVSALETMIGYKWTYLYWLLCHFPLLLLLIFLFWFVLRRKFPLRMKEIPGGYDFIQTEFQALGKISQAEKNILMIGIFTVLMWISEPFHGLSVSYIALVAAIFSCFPGFGIQSWKDSSKHIAWDVIILFGAGFALADALQRNETATWLALQLTQVIPHLGPFMAGVFLMVMVLFLRLGFANMLAITASLLPITINLAEMWGINPVWLSQIVIIACSFGYFLPVQSPSNLITYSYGYYNEKELAEMGFYVSFITMLVILLGAFFYWPYIGLSPT